MNGIQSQGQTQTRTQQNRGQPSNRNPPSLFPTLMNGNRQAGSGSIWTNNPLTDNLSSRDNTAAAGAYSRKKSREPPGNIILTPTVAPGQRSSGIGASESSSIWQRPGASTWNSTTDSQQFRPSASRSTSPPTSQQNTSNTSPSFMPTRSANPQGTAFSSSNFMTTFAPSANSLTSYSNFAESAQGDSGNAFQQSFMGFQRGSQGLSSSAFDDTRESLLPPSRHSESEAPLQFGSEAPGFGNGLSSHSRHPSRMSLSGMSTSYVQQQQPSSRSQSHSFNPQSEQAQAAFETVRAHLIRDRMQASSPGPRPNATQASTPAPSQLGWRDFTPTNGFSLTNGNMPEGRRDSLANSVHHSSLNSPRTFGTAPRQADPWQPASPLDYDTLSRIQRSQQNTMTRQTTQSSYGDPAASYNPYAELPAQIMQQMHPAFSLPFQSYGFQAGQQFFPPTGPAGMVPRTARPQDLTVGIRCQELEEFRRSSKSNRKWELKVRYPPPPIFPYHRIHVLLTRRLERVRACG